MTIKRGVHFALRGKKKVKKSYLPFWAARIEKYLPSAKIFEKNMRPLANIIRTSKPVNNIYIFQEKSYIYFKKKVKYISNKSNLIFAS